MARNRQSHVAIPKVFRSLEKIVRVQFWLVPIKWGSVFRSMRSELMSDCVRVLYPGLFLVPGAVVHALVTRV